MYDCIICISLFYMLLFIIVIFCHVCIYVYIIYNVYNMFISCLIFVYNAYTTCILLNICIHTDTRCIISYSCISRIVLYSGTVCLRQHILLSLVRMLWRCGRLPVVVAAAARRRAATLDWRKPNDHWLGGPGSSTITTISNKKH